VVLAAICGATIAEISPRSAFIAPSKSWIDAGVAMVTTELLVTLKPLGDYVADSLTPRIGL
jgi:hypothetical protein